MGKHRTTEQSVWLHKTNIFNARVYKWEDKKINDDKMWKSIKNACKNNPIENIDENISIEEAIKHVHDQFQTLYNNARIRVI